MDILMLRHSAGFEHSYLPDAEVAIKQLLPDNRGDGGSSPSSNTSKGVVRFLREARVTGQLEHPNIVPVHELGQHDDGSLYYAMRLVRGETLAQKHPGLC